MVRLSLAWITGSAVIARSDGMFPAEWGGRVTPARSCTVGVITRRRRDRPGSST